MIKNDDGSLDRSAAMQEIHANLSCLVMLGEMIESNPTSRGVFRCRSIELEDKTMAMIEEYAADAHAEGMHNGKEAYLDSDEHMEEAIDRQNDFIARVRDEINEVLDHVC